LQAPTDALMGALNNDTTLSTVQRLGAMPLVSMLEHRYRNPRPASPPAELYGTSRAAGRLK
jgi:hypothetical protein